MSFSTDSEQTRELLEKVATGNPAALERLLRLHRDYLKRIVQMRIEPALMARVDASDVVQETQVVIAKRIDDFIKRRPTSFRLWIRRKAIEQLVDQRRRHIGAQKRNVYNEQHLSNYSSMAIARQLLPDTPSKIMAKNEFQQQVRSSIEQLSEKYREVLTLKHVEALSTNEVADLLDENPSTIRQRYGRALRKLYRLLSDNEISLGGI